MAEPIEPLILGYDSTRRCWTEGEVSARVRSLSEPDRAVPLTARLVGEPDILDFTLDPYEQECFRASVRLRPGAKIPDNRRARLTIIADPASEIAAGVMHAAGFPVLLPFKDLRAQVEVQLIPYSLEVRAFVGDREISIEDVLPLEGDAHTSLRLEAAVYAVDGNGNPGQQPLALPVTIKPNLQGALCQIQPCPEGGASCSLVSEKLVLDSNLQAGTLTLEASLPEGKLLSRTLAVYVWALNVELKVTGTQPVPLGAPSPQLVLRVSNSKGEGVVGLSTRWALEPAVGALSLKEATTGAVGGVTVSYQMPTLEEALKVFQSELLSLSVRVTAGQHSQLLGEVDLCLQFQAHALLSVEKAGFTPIRDHRVELQHPGGIALSLFTSAGEKVPIASARVKALGQEVCSDQQGQARLEMGTGTPTVVKLNLELDEPSKQWSEQILKGLARLQGMPWNCRGMEASCEQVTRFVNLEYVEHLAEEEEKEYPAALANLKVLHPVIHVGELSARLFDRRYARFQEQLSSALGNIGAALFSWMGEKYFPRIGNWLTGKLRGLMRYLAGKLAGRAWLARRARGAVGTLRGWLNSLKERLLKLKRKVGSQRTRLPESVDQQLNKDFRLPKNPAMLAPGDEALEAMNDAVRKAAAAKAAREQAEQALKAAQKQLDDAQQQLARAQAQATPNPAEVSRLQGQVQSLGAGLDNATAELSKKSQALNESESAAKAAETAYKELKEMCSALDDLLGAFSDALSVLYEYGAWLLAYLLVSVGGWMMISLRKVANGVHGGGGQAMGNALEDLITKKAFVMAFEFGGYHMLEPIIRGFCKLQQSATVAQALSEAIGESSRWQERDPETMKAAIRWYYEEIEAASFNNEEAEVWRELIADLLDWLEFLLVWITRLVNIVLAVVGALVSLLTLGVGLPAWLLVSAGFSAFVEAMDRWWDVIKAAARSVSAAAGAAEVIAIILPAHSLFTARIYATSDMQQRIDQAWSYSIDDELRTRLQELRKPHSFPGETILEELNQKLESLGLQYSQQSSS